MTIRFAAAYRGGNPVIARALRPALLLRHANDNARNPADGRVLKAALRHFAEHGLSAAERARENAETAFFAGDSEGYRWWLSICRTLDRRMADAVAARRPAAGKPR